MGRTVALHCRLLSCRSEKAHGAAGWPRELHRPLVPRLATESAIFAAMHFVRFWHKADIERLSSDVRFWG